MEFSVPFLFFIALTDDAEKYWGFAPKKNSAKGLQGKREFYKNQ